MEVVQSLVEATTKSIMLRKKQKKDDTRRIIL